MKLIKNGVVKDIEKRLVRDYLSAGWKIEKETQKITKDNNKIEKK